MLAWLVLPALGVGLIWSGDPRYAWSVVPAVVAALIVTDAHGVRRAA